MSNIKKIIIIILIFLISISIYIFKNIKKNGFINVTNYSLKTLDIKENNFFMANETQKKWKVKRKNVFIGFLKLDKFILKNEDIYYSIHYEPLKDTKENVEITIPIELEDFDYHYIKYKDKIDNNNSFIMHRNNKNDLAKASLFIDSEKYFCFFSYIDVFDIQSKGVRLENFKLANNIKINKGKVILSLPNKKNTIVEQWGVLSKEKLVDFDDKEIRDILKKMDLNRVRKWGYDGLYYKIPKSYYPYSLKSFYKNPAHHVGNEFLDYDERFFKDFSIISLYTALNTQNEKGIWYTTPRSNWLYNDYNIDAPFYDTRFNTDAAIFLLRGFRKYNDELLLKGAIKYGDFFIDYANNHNFKTENGGYLVWDYTDKDLSEIPNHVSLNHLVNEMNFLYELFIDSDDIKYYNLALNLKQAIKDTAYDWIKKNKDLHYAYLIDGNYGFKDYKLLTLKDLKYSQKLFKKVDGEIDNTFKMLIDIKQNYLKQ